MRDLRRITGVAIVLVVLLRISIGWQFLYEGLWKIESMDSPQPWTAEGYLKNAQGPLRNVFRSMTGDPDDLNWLDPQKVAGRWDTWHAKFLAKHADLDKSKQDHLWRMINGADRFTAKLERLPEGVEFRGSLGGTVSYDSKGKLLVVDGKKHLTPQERDRLLALVEVVDEPAAENREKNEVGKAYQKAVRDVYNRASRHANAEVTGLSFKERLRASLEQNPDRAGVVLRAKAKEQGQEDETIESRMGEIALYQELLKRYEASVARADSDFKWDHLNRQWGEIQALRAKLVGPIKAMDDELKIEALKLLTPEQLSRGAVDVPSQMDQIDCLTMWSLTIIGALLIAGFLTPAAAIAGAGLLISFYLVIPPWTGVPEAPGPEHSYIINKNFIEALALLAIAAMPTGRWFGIDSLFNWIWLRMRGKTSGGDRQAGTPSAN